MKDAINIKKTLTNGLRLTCPHCGEGKLFSSYLKRVDVCEHCGENLVGLDADDGPAWLTIVLSTHAFGPMFMALDLAFLNYAGWLAVALETTIGFALMTTLVLTILPRAKGLFIAHMWWVERRPGVDEGLEGPGTFAVRQMAF